jgi:hypothetical protein
LVAVTGYPVQSQGARDRIHARSMNAA